MKLPKQSVEVRDALAVYGYALIASRRYTAARDLFRGMAVLFPDDRQVMMSLAVAHLALGETADALVLADDLRAGASAKEVRMLDLVRAKALFAEGHSEEAREAFLLGLSPQGTAASKGAA